LTVLAHLFNLALNMLKNQLKYHLSHVLTGLSALTPSHNRHQQTTVQRRLATLVLQQRITTSRAGRALKYSIPLSTTKPVVMINAK
jgi:hypothetical protein